MNVRSLMPFSGNRSAPQRPEADQFVSFRREMDRLFDDFFTGFGMPMPLPVPPAPAAAGILLAPSIDVSETDREIHLAAELPGVDEKDVEVTLNGDMLTIRGEKQEERKEDDRDYHLMERSLGTFARTLRLPFAVDPTQIDAEFKNGVLTLTIPKPKEAQAQVHRIAVKSGEDMPRSMPDRAAAGDKPSPG
jgi:HSP20 family protein